MFAFTYNCSSRSTVKTGLLSALNKTWLVLSEPAYKAKWFAINPDVMHEAFSGNLSSSKLIRLRTVSLTPVLSEYLCPTVWLLSSITAHLFKAVQGTSQSDTFYPNICTCRLCYMSYIIPHMSNNYLPYFMTYCNNQSLRSCRVRWRASVNVHIKHWIKGKQMKSQGLCTWHGCWWKMSGLEEI